MPLLVRGQGLQYLASKAPPFLGNLAKQSERNGRNGHPRKSDSDPGKLYGGCLPPLVTYAERHMYACESVCKSSNWLLMKL